MIIWISSYPKSGNTYVRSFLSAYYYTNDGVFDFELLKFIEQFPDKQELLNMNMVILKQKSKLLNNGFIFKEKLLSPKKSNFLKPIRHMGPLIITPLHHQK